jgi:hypothetical protein
MTLDKQQILTGQKIAAASRKDAHIDLALDPATKSSGNNGFDRLRFDHCASLKSRFQRLIFQLNFWASHWQRQ